MCLYTRNVIIIACIEYTWGWCFVVLGNSRGRAGSIWTLTRWSAAMWHLQDDLLSVGSDVQMCRRWVRLHFLTHHFILDVVWIIQNDAYYFYECPSVSEFVLFSVSGLKDEKLIKKQTYTKTEAYKLSSRLFRIFLPNVIKIDTYNFKLYHFKVGAFLRHRVLL